MSAPGAARFARRIAQAIRLAWGDVRRDGLVSVCAALTLAAALAPLLTLLGLERGVIGTIVSRMDGDPAMRSLIPEVTGGRRFDAAWFRRVAAWPEVAFVMPSTRAIAGQVDLFAPDAPAPSRVSLLPTEAGDPVAGVESSETRGLDAVVLSAPAARALGTTAGARITLAVERERRGRVESANVPVRVAAVLPVERDDGRNAYGALALVEAIQAFRDGYAVEALGLAGDGEAVAADHYPLFRLYARSIADVGRLASRLEGEGVSVVTRGREIESTLGLRRNIRAILVIVAGFSTGGFLLATLANQVAAVRRKRREAAVLVLLGYGRGWLTATSVLAAGIVAIGGIGAAGLLFGGAAAAINAHFADAITVGRSACELTPSAFAAVAGATLAAVTLPAMIVGGSAAGREPGDALRDV
jgi:putative ABC transport system permease protein